MSNKYLEKIAGRRLNSAIRFVDDVIGHSAGKAKREADVLMKAHLKGLTPQKAQRNAEHLANRSTVARVKAGLGVAGAGTAGFLGLHKYHQHKDNAILAKIDSMYKNPDDPYKQN